MTNANDPWFRALSERAREEEAEMAEGAGAEPVSDLERAALLATVRKTLGHAPAMQGRGSKRGRVLAFAGPVALLAVAAGLFLVVRPRGETALPAYVVQVAGGTALLRGGESVVGAATQLEPDGALEIVLRPQSSIASPVAAQLLLERDGQFSEVAWAPQISPAGAVLFEGQVSELLPRVRGPARLHVVVRDAARASVDATRVSADGFPDDVRHHIVPVVVRQATP
jgi:hypothetical protein